MAPPGTPHGSRAPFVERRASRIANARSVLLALSGTLVAIAAAGGVVIHIAEPKAFPSVGIGIWWALQTFTTVGYGDVVPTDSFGRIVGGIEMVIGVTFISFLTASVTSALVRRDRTGGAAQTAAPAEVDADQQAVLDAIARLEQRLERIEQRLQDSA